MVINADKPHLWKSDIAESVDLFNTWFMKFAPKAYRDTRIETTKDVTIGLEHTEDLTKLTAEVLRRHPRILQMLRMCTCPPLARDRLVGLAYASKTVIGTLEDGKLPTRLSEPELQTNLDAVSKIITLMLDVDIFPWLAKHDRPTEEQRYRAATIVADRLCGAVSDPLIRNAQERRQLDYVGRHLREKGYEQKPHPAGRSLAEMEPGTYAFRMVVVGGSKKSVNIPIDIVIQPKRRKGKLPILVEAKSAGDFTNVNKRRKEEATKVNQLRARYGSDVQFMLFLCGYFDSGYLGYEAAEGIDWIWEHRIEDMDKLGI